MSAWDHTSNQEFFSYYAEASQTPEAAQRFRSIRDCVLRVGSRSGMNGRALDVADIGCGAGTQSFVWSELSHRVHALDVNQPLLDLARERAGRQGYTIDFRLGSATELPWADESMDVCLLIELLEHVSQWERCLDECARVLRPKGVLYLTTSNKLCPIQKEFNLPLYSWYPTPLKHHFERLSTTTRPDLANYAKYPAVNWFTFYGLRGGLAPRGFTSMDRFDVMDLSKKSFSAKGLIHLIRLVPPLRWLGHVATPFTIIMSVKR